MVKRQGQKKRGIPKYTRKKIILLGVEGDNKTERHYFNHFNRLQAKYVIRFAKGNETDPVNIVANLARDIEQAGTDSFTRGDIAYAVFDTDTCQHKEAAIQQAVRTARKAGIKIAISNPCFEVWFICHFDHCTSAFCSNRAAIQKLKTYIPEYEKNVDVFPLLFNYIEEAIHRAEYLRNMHKEQGHTRSIDMNPMTDVDMIVKLLLK